MVKMIRVEKTATKTSTNQIKTNQSNLLSVWVWPVDLNKNRTHYWAPALFKQKKWGQFFKDYYLTFFFLIMLLRSPPAIQGATCTPNTHKIGWFSPTDSAFFPMASGQAQQLITHKPTFPKHPKRPDFHAIAKKLFLFTGNKNLLCLKRMILLFEDVRNCLSYYITAIACQ